MKRLMLLRHGKSDWSDSGLEDHDRPLAPRGVKSSRKVGAYLSREALVPERAWCSPAARARGTWDLVLEAIGQDVETEYRQDLYLAEPPAMLAAIASGPAGCDSLILIGHNPGLDRLTRMLIETGNRSVTASLGDNFPTAGLAVLEFETDDWAAVGPARGRLSRFVHPRNL